ncbi:PREDICTED: myosin-7-like [Nicotiana attenuata]|uniref:Myosin-7 n=1 Tax=Nicotiana attenuata TaxID=49451 RepID=A0A1J6KN05_NICAT|nr:PREDICTED: myosin-7-like [Nicotiana attenuata]OIT26248.1 myosin-7 [Nicotiana attenuata]
MSVSASVVVGSHVWVEDPEVAWIDGVVAEVNGEEITVNCTSGKTVATNLSHVYAKDTDAPSCGVDDMTKLSYLHEPGVLQNLRSRYDMNEIYTYTGSILIAVNPFKRLPHLYDKSVMEQYKGIALGELPPHPFAIADAAYRLMINEGISQSILVSGESGAGKTESTKMLMQYLAYMGGRAAAEGRSVEQQVLESNPVLEAFGNAKTVRNNNSSRFGKFVELQFDKRGRISGAAIRTYLLERSRVCQVSDPERNYHCFYLLCAAPPQDVEKYKVGNPRTFHYLNQSNFFELAGVDESEEYLATRRAMDIVGISHDEQDAIFRVVAAILHLGNVEFAKGTETDASEPKDDKSRFHLKIAAELFMCDEKSLEDSMCKRVMVTRDETITKSLDPQAAAVSRDALAKIVYSRLFDWIVNKINNSIGQDPDSTFSIGVLDIYGFESFKTNSFEQFCINLTNEKLQQHFNQHVFKMEQEEYTKEEIDWSYIEFIDNQDILDLIEKKPGGIIALLDEACMFPRSTYETFAEKLYQTFKDHKRFSKPKLSRTDFTICHYAGDVTYQTEFFLDKNKDYVVPEHQATLTASRCHFVSGLFPPLPEESSKQTKFSSIGARFKQQLQSLLETLNATEPHYVRCVKPNNLLKPEIFENQNVLQQLRCGGVLEAIRISCAGYPTRKPFDEFLSRFKVLAPEVLNGSIDEVAACGRLLEKAGLKGYQVGKTKVFLRAGQMAELDTRRNEVLGRSASIIQAKVRTYFARKTFLLLRVSAIQVQAVCRGQLARAIYECMRREAASLRIQKDARKYLARKSYRLLCFSAVSIQAGLRGMAARNELQFRKRTNAAIFIQSDWRRYLKRLHYRRMKKAAIVLQCAWRAKMARRELRKLKMAAKETGALQEAKSKLEKEVEELTQRLQVEKRMRDNLEEAKTQETMKLQSALEETRLQLKETKELLVKERGATTKDNLEETKAQETMKLQSALEETRLQLQEAKEQLVKERGATTKVAEQGSVIQEVRVIDQGLVDKLNAENEQLKVIVNSLEKKIDDREKKYEETVKISEERLKQVLEAESKITRLKEVMQSSKELLLKDPEASTKLLEEVEFQVVDQEVTGKLTAENEQLKVLVNSLEKKIDETEKKYEETSKLSEERLKQALDAEAKIIELKISMQRLEEKLSDIEDQQILRQQALHLPSGKTSNRFAINTQPSENGHHEPQAATPARRFGTDSMRRSNAGAQGKWFGTESMRRSMAEKQRESVDNLIKCVSQDLGFSEGKPVAAFTIYKCLLHWNSFEAEKTNVFDRLIQMIGSAIEDETNNNQMAYWLSNGATLLFLLQHTLKTTSSAPSKPPQPTSFFGRMAQSFRSSSANIAIGGLDTVRQVEAKQPALLFKLQLSAYVEKIYGIIRDNWKRDLSSLLTSCIQASQISKGVSSQSPRKSLDGRSPPGPWDGLIERLNGLLGTLKENYVHPVFVQKILNQIFSYINVQLFNSLLLNKKCCSFSNGEYVKAGLQELELWCGNVKEEYVGSSWDELKHVRQAVGFLVINQKSRLSSEDLTTDLCPILSSQQLYRICTLYWDEDFNTQGVSPDVISSFKDQAKEDGNDADKAKEADNNFILDDNSSIPISVEEINSSLKDVDFTGVKPAKELLEHPAFQFLCE